MASQSLVILFLKALVASRKSLGLYPVGSEMATAWIQRLHRSLDGFFQQTQRYVTGEVRLKLYKGSCSVLGRRSPHSLYDSRLANQANLGWFDDQSAQGFTTLWTLPARLAARHQRGDTPPEGRTAP